MLKVLVFLGVSSVWAVPTTANQKALITAKDAAHSAALLASTSMDWDAFGKETHDSLASSHLSQEEREEIVSLMEHMGSLGFNKVVVELHDARFV